MKAIRRAVALGVCSAVWAVAPGVASAQADDGSSAEAANRRPATAVTLSGLLDVVVRQNPDLARTEVDIAVTDAEATTARGLDDWRLTASGLWVTNRSEFVETNVFQVTAQDSLTVTGELIKPLPTGGEIGLSATGGFTDVTTVFLQQDMMGAVSQEEFTGTTGRAALTARISHPLLGGSGVKIARADRRRARLSRDRAVLLRRARAHQVVREVIDAYWELAYAIGTVAIRQSSLQLAREQLRITRLGIEQKVLAPTEALAIEQAIAVREQAVLAAEVEVSERSLALRQLVGMEIGPGEVLLSVGDQLETATAPVDLDEALALARERNADLAAARAAVASASHDADVARDAVRPRLEAGATVGPDASALGARETLEQFALLKSFSATATLTYNQTFANRSARGEHRRTRELVRRARVDVAALERSTSAQVVQAVNRIRISDKQLQVSEIAVKLARTNLDNEKILARAGDARAFDVLQRQDELAQAELSRSRAAVDYRRAVAELEALTGDLLERYGVTIAE